MQAIAEDRGKKLDHPFPKDDLAANKVERHAYMPSATAPAHSHRAAAEVAQRRLVRHELFLRGCCGVRAARDVLWRLPASFRGVLRWESEKPGLVSSGPEGWWRMTKG